MPSPFPGMDPYLETPDLWPDVHHELMSQIRAALTPRLRPRYVARVELRVYVSNEDDPGREALVPDLRIETAARARTGKRNGNLALTIDEPIIIPLLIDNEIEEAYLAIKDRKSGALVTVIELMSPTNKIRGSEGRKSFMSKKRAILASDVHWVEIDLLRAGDPSVTRPPLRPSDYRVLIYRGNERERGRYWPIGVRQPFPVIGIPLKGKDPDVPLDLGAALNAAYHAIIVNHQMDLAARRGLDAELTPELEQQLSELPERLQAIIANTSQQGSLSEAAWSAKRLAVATRQMEPQPITGIKIVRSTAEIPDSPAAAVLDGVWNSVDVKTMWRHPSKPLTTIVLDLGTERTVTAVRIWNDNEAGAVHRGWKDTEVYVSNSLSPNTPAATGIVPQAPGAASTPDFGSLLMVPFARGRYVTLQLKSVWREDGTAGLSEIQVLGF